METRKSSRTVEELVRAYATPLSIIAVGVLIALVISTGQTRQSAPTDTQAKLQESVLPAEGVTLPIAWGDLGAKLVETGTIDPAKLEALYKDRGGFSESYRVLLEKNVGEKIVMTQENAGYLLNLLWALGLANKNPILEDEMMSPAYGGADKFASTGGWTLARGSAMNHYDKHAFMPLTNEQQALVDRVSRNIYRPCCGNSTHFPDCNHGMAMLGLLELMAAQGANEQDMYKAALAVNSYWFPETYLTLATYMRQKGIAWIDVDPKKMLSAPYSSSSGYQNISAQVKKLPEVQGGGGCSA